MKKFKYSFEVLYFGYMNNGFQNVKLIYMNLDSFFGQSFKEITLKTNLVQLILKSQSGPYLCQAKNSCIMLTCIPPAFMNDSLCSLITWLLHSMYHSRHPSTLPSFLESLSFLTYTNIENSTWHQNQHVLNKEKLRSRITHYNSSETKF